MNLSKTKVKWSVNYGTAQIYNSGVELALCSDNNEQISTFVYCKDFFQDALVVAFHPESNLTCTIYGYRYDPKVGPPVPETNLKVLLANAGDPKLADKIEAVPDFLHQIEDALGVQRTVIEECESPPDKYKRCGVYLLTADPIWMHAPPILSCWTLLARNALQHKKGEKWEATIQAIIEGKVPAAQTHDRVYITYGKPGIDLILKKGVKTLFGPDKKKNYPVDKAGSAMHHYSGIVSYGSSVAKQYFPDWEYPAPQTTKPPSVCFS